LQQCIAENLIVINRLRDGAHACFADIVDRV